jgi:plastocyanin
MNYYTPTPTQQNQNQAVAANAIYIKNYAFDPKTLTVAVGTTVTWTNDDSATHRINSQIFNSSDLKPGSSFSYTFQSSGTYDYTCSLHPSMQGTIIVQ